MKKKYLILPLICIMLFLSISSVHATNNSGVSDREMAIACALSYAPLQEGKKMSENFDIKNFTLISDVVNLVNGKINLHDFATIEEMDDWIVDDYHNKEISEKSMAVFTLRKGNNIIIAFRGTDFEALADVVYGITNYHNQEEYADKYVLEILEKYSKMEGNYNIYVAGHSLGGYLAQTAGATIEENISKYKNLKLARIVSFNGIGINFLTWLGDKINYGNQAETIATLKKLGEDGRLVEYYTYGDLVSALGVHYGEMRKLLPSIDSISYHRENNVALANLNQKINFGAKLEEIIKRDNLNIFKTEIHGAKKLYQLDESILAYLVLTHEADAFATIEVDKGINSPEIKVVENQKGLIAQLAAGKTKFGIRDSITLKAITNYASVKKYEWYVSSDKENWELVSTSTVNVNDPTYDASAKPTNLYKVDINNFEAGETKYFKIISYYDDIYVSSKYNKNSSNGQYEYVEQKEKSRKEGYKTVETIIQVKHESKMGMLKNFFKSFFDKDNYISGALDIFAQFKDNIKQGNFIDGIREVFSGVFDLFFKGQIRDITEGSVIGVVEKLTKLNPINILGYISSWGDNVLNPETGAEEIVSGIMNGLNDTKINIVTDFAEISSDGNEKDEEKDKSNIVSSNNYAEGYAYEGNKYKLAITEDELEGLLEKISTKGITINNAKEANQAFIQNKSDSLAKYYIDILENNIENPTLEDSIKTSVVPKTVLSGTTDNLKSCINNKKISSVHVEGNNGQWATCVGYTNEGNAFSDYLFINPNTGALAKGDSPEIKDFYTIREFDTIFLYE